MKFTHMLKIGGTKKGETGAYNKNGLAFAEKFQKLTPSMKDVINKYFFENPNFFIENENARKKLIEYGLIKKDGQGCTPFGKYIASIRID